MMVREEGGEVVAGEVAVLFAVLVGVRFFLFGELVELFEAAEIGVAIGIVFGGCGGGLGGFVMVIVAGEGLHHHAVAHK